MMSIGILRDKPWQRSAELAVQYAYPACVFVVARAWTAAWASLSVIWWRLSSVDLRLYYGTRPVDDLAGGWLLAPWQRWDTIWYVLIAGRGYSPTDYSTAFFPLYPILINLTARVLPVNQVAAGLLVSSLAALGAFVLLYRMIIVEYNVATARRALIYLAVFPTAFFLFAAYSESVFLLLALAAWLSAKKSHWLKAGLFGGLAALTRPQGFLLLLPLAWIFVSQYRRKQVSLWQAGYLGTIIAAAAGFVIYLFMVDGSPAAWFEIEGSWRMFAMPWVPVEKSIRVIISSGDSAFIFLNALDLALTALFVGLAVSAAKRRAFPEAAYISILVLPPLFTVATFDPYLPLASISRFLVLAFPGFAMLGNFQLRGTWVILFASFSFLIQTILLTVFTHWMFAG